MARLKLTKLAAGSTVAVSCAGKGCPLKRRTVRSPNGGTVDVRRLLKGRALRAGDRLTLRISAPGDTARQIVITVRRGKRPAVATRPAA